MPAEAKRKAKDRNAVERRMFALYDRDEIPISPQQIRRARRAYYAMISYCDDVLGRLLGALEIAALADNTIVVVTSDHGDMLGERGLWYKMTFYERAVRVPLIVRRPGHQAAQRVSARRSRISICCRLLPVSSAQRVPRAPAWTAATCRPA